MQNYSPFVCISQPLIESPKREKLEEENLTLCLSVPLYSLGIHLNPLQTCEDAAERLKSWTAVRSVGLGSGMMPISQVV